LHTATGEALRTTSDHPFVRGQWVRVKRLRVGDSLVSQRGQRHVLRRIDRQPEHVTVYNFTVTPWMSCTPILLATTLYWSTIRGRVLSNR
jgi:hypothetical protein